MSNQQLANIESTLQILVKGQEALRGDVSKLDGRVSDLDGKVSKLDDRLTDLDRHMHVLHESALATIKDLIPPVDPEPRAAQASLDELRVGIGHRLEPLELVVAEHSQDIEKLKESRARPSRRPV